MNHIVRVFTTGSLFAAALAFCPGAMVGDGRAADAGIVAKKLKIIDRGSAGEGKIVFTATQDPGIEKGPDGVPLDLDAVVEIFYAEDEITGGTRLDLPQGPSWTGNSGSAKYVDKSAPPSGAVHKALIKPAKVVKVVAAALVSRN